MLQVFVLDFLSPPAARCRYTREYSRTLLRQPGIWACAMSLPAAVRMRRKRKRQSWLRANSSTPSPFGLVQSRIVKADFDLATPLMGAPCRQACRQPGARKLSPSRGAHQPVLRADICMPGWNILRSVVRRLPSLVQNYHFVFFSVSCSYL
jgi:hypothetical protein